MTVPALPDILIQPIIARALSEDLGTKLIARSGPFL